MSLLVSFFRHFLKFADHAWRLNTRQHLRKAMHGDGVEFITMSDPNFTVRPELAFRHTVATTTGSQGTLQFQSSENDFDEIVHHEVESKAWLCIYFTRWWILQFAVHNFLPSRYTPLSFIEALLASSCTLVCCAVECVVCFDQNPFPCVCVMKEDGTHLRCGKCNERAEYLWVHHILEVTWIQTFYATSSLY